MAGPTGTRPGSSDARDAMLAEICREFRLTRKTTGLGAPDPRVLSAMARVPRERFVPVAVQGHSYENRALTIGCGQTISQPFIVALMSTLLCTREDQRILEVGTGSGYQAAVLACLVHRVFSVEIIPELAAGAAADLRDAGFSNVAVRCGDGARGWPEQAPFDGILVTAAVREVPAPLLRQLACGGRLVLPVDRGAEAHKLVVIQKDETGGLSQVPVIDVLFVPFDHGGGGTPQRPKRP